MAKENRPKPPPLDDTPAATLSDEELAAQGKTTLAELESKLDSKLAEAGSAKSPTAASPLETQSDAELAARAAPPPPAPPPMNAPAPGKPRALIREPSSKSSTFSARPDPTCPVGEDVPVVRFNWCGLVRGVRADVAAGTPAECLPGLVLESIRATPNAVIAPRGPKPPPNPHAP